MIIILEVLMSPTLMTQYQRLQVSGYIPTSYWGPFLGPLQHAQGQNQAPIGIDQASSGTIK